MVHREKGYFLMTCGVRKSDKKKTYFFYPYPVCVKDVYESTTQAIGHKQTLNKTNHKLVKHSYFKPLLITMRS
jgi:hypothetical protein